jgi:predicted amidohydrolase
VEKNLASAAELIGAAAADGARLVVLPENFALMPARGRDKALHAETPGLGPIQDFLSATARQHGVWIVGGSIPLESPEPGRVYGACPVVDDEGATRAIYRKIHLFDIDVPDANESYRESKSMYPGDELVVCDTPAGRVGLTICYDVRFPELYRQLVDDGATLFTVPAAFTVPTGRAHWHTLLKARAIENLCWVIAPGQSGEHPDHRSTYGHSLIVDPWGRILAEQPEGEGYVAADIDRDMQEQLRREAPMLDNRRLKTKTRIVN